MKSKPIAGLEKSDFEDFPEELPRIIYLIQGHPGTLKSTFYLSGYSPIVVLDLDDRLERVAQPWIRGERGHPPKTIKRVPIKLPRPNATEFMTKDERRKDEDRVAAEAKKSLEKFTRNLEQAYESSFKVGGVRLIAIDQLTDLTKLRTLAEFGRTKSIEPWQRGDANLAVQTMMKDALLQKASVVFVCRLKEERKTIKKTVQTREGARETEDSVTTGRWITDAPKEALSIVQVGLETSMTEKDGPVIKVIKAGLNYKKFGKVYSYKDGDFEDADGYVGPFATIGADHAKGTYVDDWMKFD